MIVGGSAISRTRVTSTDDDEVNANRGIVEELRDLFHGSEESKRKRKRRKSFQATTTDESELSIVTDSIGSNGSIGMKQVLLVTGDQRISFPDGFPMNDLRGELLLDAASELKDTSLFR